MDGIDVAVVGAGIHGASVAYNLASRGVAVRVYDQGSVAAGPTARSSAVCRAYYTNEFLARAAHESLDVFRNFALDAVLHSFCHFRSGNEHALDGSFRGKLADTCSVGECGRDEARLLLRGRRFARRRGSRGF